MMQGLLIRLVTHLSLWGEQIKYFYQSIIYNKVDTKISLNPADDKTLTIQVLITHKQVAALI